MVVVDVRSVNCNSSAVSSDVRVQVSRAHLHEQLRLVAQVLRHAVAGCQNPLVANHSSAAQIFALLVHQRGLPAVVRARHVASSDDTPLARS